MAILFFDPAYTDPWKLIWPEKSAKFSHFFAQITFKNNIFSSSGKVNDKKCRDETIILDDERPTPESNGQKVARVKEKPRKRKISSDNESSTEIPDKKVRLEVIKEASEEVVEIIRKPWDFSKLDPNEWEFVSGEFICVYCGVGSYCFCVGGAKLRVLNRMKFFVSDLFFDAFIGFVTH